MTCSPQSDFSIKIDVKQSSVQRTVQGGSALGKYTGNVLLFLDLCEEEIFNSCLSVHLVGR